MGSMAKPQFDRELYEAALLGLEHRKQEIERRITELNALMGRAKGRTAVNSSSGRPHRKPLSAEARQRIAAAQRKRWAAYKRKQRGTGGAKVVRSKVA